MELSDMPDDELTVIAKAYQDEVSRRKAISVAKSELKRLHASIAELENYIASLNG